MSLCEKKRRRVRENCYCKVNAKNITSSISLKLYRFFFLFYSLLLVHTQEHTHTHVSVVFGYDWQIYLHVYEIRNDVTESKEKKYIKRFTCLCLRCLCRKSVRSECKRRR